MAPSRAVDACYPVLAIEPILIALAIYLNRERNESSVNVHRNSTGQTHKFHRKKKNNIEKKRTHKPVRSVGRISLGSRRSHIHCTATGTVRGELTSSFFIVQPEKK